jgi:hypothetical protein
MSVRQILRTNRGSTLPMGSPDTNIYVRRIRYTPLSDRAIADAYRCTSMFACYGPMAPAPMANASMFVTLASTANGNAAVGRRALLATTAANAAALSAAVADSLAGVPEEQVTTTPSAYGLSFTLELQNIAAPGGGFSALDTYQSDGLQTALLSGLSGDVSPGSANILVEDVRESSDGLSVSIDIQVTGYTSLAEVHADYARITAIGAAAFDNAAAAVNNALGEVSTAYITPSEITNSAVDDAAMPDFTSPTLAHPVAKEALLADVTKCPSYPDFWDATCVDDAGDAPSVWCPGCVLMDISGLVVVTTYTVSVPVAATAVDAFEASLDGALNSGAIGASLTSGAATRRRLLQAGSATLNVSTTNSLVAQRLTTAAVLESVICGAVETQLEEWRASAIAFIIAFGVLAVGTAVGCAFMAGKRAGQRAGSAPPSSPSATPSKERRDEALRVVAYEQQQEGEAAATAPKRASEDCEAPAARPAVKQQQQAYGSDEECSARSAQLAARGGIVAARHQRCADELCDRQQQHTCARALLYIRVLCGAVRRGAATAWPQKHHPPKRFSRLRKRSAPKTWWRSRRLPLTPPPLSTWRAASARRRRATCCCPRAGTACCVPPASARWRARRRASLCAPCVARRWPRWRCACRKAAAPSWRWRSAWSCCSRSSTVATMVKRPRRSTWTL